MDIDDTLEKAPLQYTPPAMCDIPQRSDGVIDVPRIDVADRDHRTALVAQLADLCRSYGADGTVETIIPAVVAASVYDDVVLLIANALAEVGHSLRPSRSPLRELTPLLLELYDHVDGHIGLAAARATVDFASSSCTSDDDRLQFVSMVCKLASGGEGVSAKCAAAAMLPAAHNAAQRLASSSTANVVEAKRRVARTRTLFSNLIRDASSAVRRAAASSLAEWLDEIQTPAAVADALPQVRAWATDLIRDRLQDSVRFAAVPHLVSIARKSPPADWNAILLLAAASAKDSAWRVRWTAARHLVSLMLVIPTSSASLLPSLRALAQDEEAEVRSCVAQRLGEAASVLPEHLVSTELVPLIIALSSDRKSSVKVAAAGSVCDVCRSCEESDVETLFEIVLKFLSDASPVVQLSVLRSLPNMKKRLARPNAMARITQILKHIGEVSISPWRVRERVAEQLRHLAYFVVDAADIGSFEAMLHQLVSDPVAAVRQTAVGSLPFLASRFGPVWTRSNIERFGLTLRDGYRERQIYMGILAATLPFASASSSATGGGPSPPDSGTPASRSPLTNGGNVPTFDGHLGAPTAAVEQQQQQQQQQEANFWQRIRSVLRELSNHPVSNLRLAACRWAFSSSAARIPQLFDLRQDLQIGFAKDSCDEVRAMAQSLLRPASPF